MDMDSFRIKNGIFKSKGVFRMLKDINTRTIHIEGNVFEMKGGDAVTHKRRLSREEIIMDDHSSYLFLRGLFAHEYGF
jgi:hypothetical protein